MSAFSDLPKVALSPYKIGPGDTDCQALVGGTAGAWDDTRMLHPCIAHDGTTVRMYYTGYNGTVHKIGMAHQPLAGFTPKGWTKYNGTGGPIISNNNFAWDAAHSGWAWVTYDTELSLWRMWRGGFDVSDFLKTGYHESADGITWDLSPAGVSNPILSPTVAWENKYTYLVSILKESPTDYKMLYVGDDPSLNGQLGLATSTDGKSWTKYAGNPVFSPGVLAWEDNSVFSPRTLQRGADGIYRILYAAKPTTGTDQGPNHQSLIGYAQSADLITWTRGAGNPILITTKTWEISLDGTLGELENPHLFYHNRTNYIYYDAFYGRQAAIGVCQLTPKLVRLFGSTSMVAYD